MATSRSTPDDIHGLIQRIAALEAENTTLRRKLGERPPSPTVDVTPNGGAATHVRESSPTALSAEDKIGVFRQLFRGRTDVYPARWESTTGRSGYAPACANEWRPGVCEKPRIRCADCQHRAFLPVTDELIRQHLTGKITAGVYPLLADDNCHFLAIDFDGEDWRADVTSVRETCECFDVPVAIEISRSGNGAHLWIFFDGAIAARDARSLGTALLSHTCARRRVLELSSYDRLFPNQDRMPKGGFGNLIALPLQRTPRDHGRSVFVDSTLTPWPDQWAFLTQLARMPVARINPVIRAATGDSHPLDVAFISEEDEAEPWKRPPPPTFAIAGLPVRVNAVLANGVYFEKDALPPALANRLIRLAAFQNPEFYRAQAMRFPVWNKPRIIGCATSHPRHLSLPRGCLDAARALFQAHGVGFSWTDERTPGERLAVEFCGELRADQEEAVAAMLVHDTGIFVAPTGFGKTVVAAAIVARRSVNTLVLVHRHELQRQWIEQLDAFLVGPDADVGMLGGGRSRLTGRIDVAVLQSLTRVGEDTPRLERYGQIIVDECHHISAVSFESVLKSATARYVLGLTATPIRRDGLQPIITMQCGPVRHTSALHSGAPQERVVYCHMLPTQLGRTEEKPIQDVLGQISADAGRNARIATDIAREYQAGRNILVLTERTQHLNELVDLVAKDVDSLIVLHGRLRPGERGRRIEALNAMPESTPRVVIATGKLIGEGFDHAPLDTLFLAMPISWKGTLQQYAGRLSRSHVTKTRVVVHDYLDAAVPVLVRMWKRRCLGYRAIGYVLTSDRPENMQQDFVGSRQGH